MDPTWRIRLRAERTLERVIATTALRAVDQSFADPSSRRAYVLRCAIEDAESVGVRVVRTLKQRHHDDKVILLCETKDGAAAVFKYVGRQGSRGAARSHGSTLELAEASGVGIFPRRYAAGQHYSLEEWIEGAALKHLDEHEWRDVDLVRFFHDLRRFSRSTAAESTAIRQPEIQLILSRYVRRAVRFIQYHKALRRLPALTRLYRHHRSFQSTLDAFNRIASRAEFPPHLVIDDLNDANILYSSRIARPVIIDVEDVKPGILGFDCVWLLTTMARRACPTSQLIDAYRAISNEAFLLDRSEVRLSQLLFHMLLTADVATIGDGSRSTTALLRVVTADLNHIPEFACRDTEISGRLA